MAGKKDILGDALIAAMRALSERDAMALSRTGSDPARFLPYTSNYRRTQTSFYDPKYWSVTEDHLEYPEGTIVGTRDKLVPIEPTRRLENILKSDPELMYRGMSAEELANFLRSGEIKSNSSYNMTGQEGLTYFTSDPDSAEFYANSFAPEGHKPNMERPAYVVAAKRAPSEYITHVPGVAEHEIGVNRITPAQDVIGIYRGTTTDFDPGLKEKGLYVAPRASLNWEEKSLDDVLKGKAEGGSVREGYAGKGRVVGDAIDKALKAIERLDPKSEEWAANLDRFYEGTHPNYRQKYYTGTSKDKDFTAFQESRHGTWLTNNPSSASDYALANDSQGFRPGRGWEIERTNTASRVIPAYARVRNPYTGDKPEWVMNSNNYKKAQSDWFDQLRSQGYDAWSPESQKGDLLVVLKDQGRAVKSAIGNTGQFDPNARHMGKAEGGEVDPYADEAASAKAAMAEKQYGEQPWSEWAGDIVGNAVNTAKAILPTALGGEGRVGVTDIARGAYEGAKDAVTFPGDVLTGKQALYDESGRPLEGAVGRSLNTVGAVGGASSLVPVPSNSLRVFGGTKSLTADKNALAKAQIMEGNGEDAEAIRQATGWRRGAEGRWRYEISDAGTATDKGKWITDVNSATNGVYAKLGDYFDHPELYAAYPEFKNMEVKGYYGNGPEYGYYKPRYDKSGTIAEPYIGLNLNYLTSNQTRNTLLHEIQHAIQQKEGFVNGANPLNFAPDTIPNPDVAIYEDALIHNPAMKEYVSTIGSPAWKDAVSKSNQFFEKAYQDRFKELEAIEDKTGKNMGPQYKALSDEYEAVIDQMYPIFARVKELGRELRSAGIPVARPSKKFLTPHEAYERTAGEVEARNVQHRKDWTPEQRAKTSPESTQEYVNDAQYIDWNDTSWRKGYSVGGASDSDRDIESAMMIAGAR